MNLGWRLNISPIRTLAAVQRSTRHLICFCAELFFAAAVRTARKVRLGITAPRNVEVHRQEIFERIKSERALERE